MDLANFFKTKTQAVDFCNKISEVCNKAYNTGFSLGDELANEFGVQKKDELLRFLSDCKVNIADSAQVQAFLKKLLDEVGKMPLVDLTLAFEPKEKNMKSISDWFVTRLGKAVVLELSVDEGLIAGAKIKYNGKYGDYSVRPVVSGVVEKALSNGSKV
jgi:F0F1-type ATP synthase delta subunit